MGADDESVLKTVLTGRTALITGATGDSAVAVIRAFAATGARLALTARDVDRLHKRTRELGLEAGRVMAIAADLAVPQEVEALVQAVACRWGGVDVLVNLAGGWGGGTRLAEMSVDDWDAVMNSNLRTAFLINRAVLPHMVEQGWGRIVNVASRAAESPGARQAAYNVAKAGVAALTASIAQDYARQGVVANCISPSIIDSPANRRAMPKMDPSRFLKPEELAAMAVVLCSEEAAGLNGANIPMYARV